jgi:hypothetical protein
MACQRFNEIQAQIIALLEKLKTAADYRERRELLIDLRSLIAELDREVQGPRPGPPPRPD